METLYIIFLIFIIIYLLCLLFFLFITAKIIWEYYIRDNCIYFCRKLDCLGICCKRKRTNSTTPLLESDV